LLDARYRKPAFDTAHAVAAAQRGDSAWLPERQKGKPMLARLDALHLEPCLSAELLDRLRVIKSKDGPLAHRLGQLVSKMLKAP
jgi:hypothetical protein